MKIRIKNIFVNKKINDKKEKEFINTDIKKVYDMKDDTKSKKHSVEEEKIKEVLSNKEPNKKKLEEITNVKKESIDNEEINNKEQTFYSKKRRNGYEEGGTNRRKNNSSNLNKIKLYFDNLVKNKNKLSRGYYVLLMLMVSLGAGSLYLASKTYQLFNREDYNVYSSIDLNDEELNKSSINEEQSVITSNIEEQSNNTSNLDTISEFKTEVKKENTSSAKSQSVSNTVKVKPLSFVKPLDGKIQKMYSSDKVIYSKTLDLWKIHDGIDVSADIGTYIKSIEQGTVEKVYDDSFYGITIVINHGQGYKSSYANLDKSTLVKENQKVVKGQKIGKVGNSAIGEVKDEPHIHFMLYKNNNIVDPTYIFD